MSDNDDPYDMDGEESQVSDGFETIHHRLGQLRPLRAAEAQLREPTLAFDNLDIDQARPDDTDKKSDTGSDFGAMIGGKSQKKKKDDQEQAELVEVFDFRRGEKHWPRSATLITEESAKELIATALAEANKKTEKASKAGSGGAVTLIDKGGDKSGKDDDEVFGAESSKKKGEDGDDQDEGGGERSGRKSPSILGGGMGPLPPGAGGGWGGYASSSESERDPDDDIIDPQAISRSKESQAPVEARFEIQKDRSTALLIPAGCRLKLDISAITHDGREKKLKAERERIALARLTDAQREKKEAKAKAKKKSKGWGWGGGGWDSSGWSGWDKDVWGPLKTYVNEYTITMDVKFKGEIPRDGVSLFQTSLVYTEEAPGSGRKSVKQSDGECIVGANGGVGIFGQLGDTTKVKIEPGRWRRIVIVVRNVSEGKGELRTFIDGQPCAVVKRDAFVMDGRFALDSACMYLFSSQKGSMMPGDILLRYVRIDPTAYSDDAVKSSNARDKVISMFEEERDAKIEEQRKGLSLAVLFPKPRPIWTAPTLVGAVGDPFIEKTIYEGSSVLSWSYKVLNLALRRAVLQDSPYLRGMEHEERQVLSDMLHVLHQSGAPMNHMLKLLQNPNDGHVMSFLNRLRKFLAALNVGDSLFLPALIERIELMILVERTNEQMFRFTIVQTDPNWGLQHHAVSPIFGPKLKYRTACVLSNVPKKNALDNVFWMAVYALAIRPRAGDTTRFYDVLLPFLTGKPLETSLWEAEVAALAWENDAPASSTSAADNNSTAPLERDPGNFGEWASPQRSETAYVRCLLHVLKHWLKSRGMSVLRAKQVLLALRGEFIAMLDNDLQYVHPDDNGQRVCRIACAQLSYAAVKLVGAARVVFPEGNQVQDFANVALEHTRVLIDGINSKLSAWQDVETDLPPQIDLRGPIGPAGTSTATVQTSMTTTTTADVTATTPTATATTSTTTKETPPEDNTGKEIDITIRSSTGRSADFNVKCRVSHLVIHLQERIAKSTGLAPSEQKLIFLGKVLRPDATLHESGVLESGMAIQLQKAMSGPAAAEGTIVSGDGKKLAGGTVYQIRAEELRERKNALRRNEPNAKPMETNYMDALAWDVEQTEPNPGQPMALRKYVPVDMLQMPTRVETREDAVRALRLCDRLCSLLDNQPHTVKNDRFIIANLVSNTFIQLVPVPKPRGADAAFLHISGRAERRRVKKSEKRKGTRPLPPPSTDDTTTPAPLSKQQSATTVDSASKKVNDQPDFSIGAQNEAIFVQEPCIWDQPIKYELQVELMLTLQRLTEHMVAATFSIQQDRPFDSVVIVTIGCIAAIADAVMRRRASDLPSEVCSHLMGQTRDGKQLGHAGFGISPAQFAIQTETIEAHTAEICLARTAVLDYFQSPQQRRLEKFMNWERHYELKPDRTLIKYLRSVIRETAESNATPHLLLVDGNPVLNSLLLRSYAELRPYRDIVFWWKCLMNPDVKAFPNWVDTRKDGSTGAVSRFQRMGAQLHWQFEQSQTTQAYAVTCNWNGLQLKCRPEPDRDAKGETFSKERQPPVHRYPSTATPSFYVTDLPPIKTEDDVIYRPNLPGFEDDVVVNTSTTRPSSSSGGTGKGKKPTHVARQQVLGQHDSELLISYLTVPYLRLPLVITFFASDDRLHKLQSKKLRAILDSVLFEPGRYLSLDLVGVAPTMIPTPHQNLLATPFGLLLNELVRAPDTTLKSVDALLEGALALDTGSVCDLGETDFNSSVDIILYTVRMGVRVLNYISFLVAHATNEHDCIKTTSLRDLHVSPDCLAKLEIGRTQIRKRLLEDFEELFEDYLKKLDQETAKDPNNEKLIDRNSRLAADLHATKILMHRNTRMDEYTAETTRALIGSFVFLTTRHTWNKATRASGRLLVPETELYEVLQVQRRNLIKYCRALPQGPLDKVMQTALQIATSNTGSYRAHGQIVEAHNRWARISGDRSVGRFAVGSTRTVAELGSEGGTPRSSATGGLGPRQLSSGKGGRMQSAIAEVGEVADTSMLGVELDLGIASLTLRAKHLAALPSDVANAVDTRDVFGTATIQASMLERGQNRTVYRLVGLHHDLEAWSTAHGECPPLGEVWERDYDPSELFDSEGWIPPLFEPVRKSFFNGPQPPPMTFLLPERPLPANAEVAMMVGTHQLLGGAFKLVVLFRRLKCVHVYTAVTHGRRFWWTLTMSTDVRFTLRELQPSHAPRQTPPPEFWKRGAGEPYPPSNAVLKYLLDDVTLDRSNATPERSVLIVRDTAHPDNLSHGREVMIPSRFLYGMVPHCLLDAYRFWRDETGDIANGRMGHMRLMGYPLQESEAEHMIRIEVQAIRSLEVLGFLPTRSVRVIRKRKDEVVKEFEQNKRLAQLLETLQVLVRPKRRSSKAKAKEAAEVAAAAAVEAATTPTSKKGDNEEDVDADADDEEDGDDKTKNKYDEDEDDESDVETLLFVGSNIEYAIRTNTWVDAVILVVHDDDTLDVELKGTVHSNVVLQRVSVRDIRKKQNVDPTNPEAEASTTQAAIPASTSKLGGSSRSNTGKPRKQLVKTQKSQKDGEGVWRWEGMSDSDEADWASNSSDDEATTRRKKQGGADDDSTKNKKDALTFTQITSLQSVMEAAGYDEATAVKAIKDLAKEGMQFSDVPKLARAIMRKVKGVEFSESHTLSRHLQIASENDHVLLNALYAPKGSRLYSLMRTLARIENMSNILIWVKAQHLDKIHLLHNPDPHVACPSIDLVEFPRLKLSFTARADHEGVVRLYSLDHSDVFITNERSPMINKMLNGIPHSLLLSNTQGETQVLVPVVAIRRPLIYSQPFTTNLVLDREDIWAAAYSQRYFMYPIHVSLSFLMTKGIDSALYLCLLRLFSRDYPAVFRLAESIASDTAFSYAGQIIFHALAWANDDLHPDAHACRLKISLVTIDSGVKLPWDLTLQFARYITKLSHVSSVCRLSMEEELQLLETDNAIAYEVTSPAYKKAFHTPYVRALVKNRQQALSGALKGGESKVSCFAPPRVPLSNWPFYQDNTVFGEVYSTMIEIKTVEEWDEALLNPDYDPVSTAVTGETPSSEAGGGGGITNDQQDEEDEDEEEEEEGDA